MVNLKPASQAEAKEQEAFFTGRLGYVLVYCLFSLWGGSLPSTVSLVVSYFWGLEMQPPPHCPDHHSQALKSLSWCKLCYYWLWWDFGGDTGARHLTI